MKTKKVIVRKCRVDPTEGLKNKKVLKSRRTKIRKFLTKQSRQTGRGIADLISQSLTKDEFAMGLQLMLERVTPSDSTGSIFPPPEAAEVKEEPQSNHVSN